MTNSEQLNYGTIPRRSSDCSQTKKQLSCDNDVQEPILAATALIDSGGEHAVTLRAVGHASGSLITLPKGTCESQDALLAAVATADFIMLTKAFNAVRHTLLKAAAKLVKALGVVVDFSAEHPARYRLLSNDPAIADPAIAAGKGELENAALAAFSEFILIVQECQSSRSLRDIPEATLAGLLLQRCTVWSLFRRAKECTRKGAFQRSKRRKKASCSPFASLGMM